MYMQFGKQYEKGQEAKRYIPSSGRKTLVLTLAFHPESSPKSQCHRSELFCVSYETLFPGSYEFVYMIFFGNKMEMCVERMLSLRNHGTSRGAVRN